MTSDVVASALAGLGPMMMQSQRKPVDKYGARRQFGDALLMQGAQATPLRGGVVEGLARAGQAALGGWMANKADREQIAEEEAQSKALMDAIGAAQTRGPNGQVDINLNPVAAALAKTNPTVAAYLLTMDALARRQQGQMSDTARMITGGGAPPAGVPTDQGAIPGGPLPPPGFSGAGPGPITANNPGNMIDGRGGFQQFGSPPEGVAATIKNFQSYPAKFNGGRPMTLLQIANEWAPDPRRDPGNPMLRGNNPAAWARNVAAASGLPPDQPIDVNDPQVALALVRGIHVAEKGAGALYQPDVYMRGLQMVRGQPQAAAQPPQQPPMAQPGPAMPPPASVASAPPMESGGIPDDSGQDRGMSPGFGSSPTVRLPPQMRLDDGSREMAVYNRWLAAGAPAAQQETALKYYQTAQAKALAAQQAAMDAANKAPPMMGRTDQGGVAHVEGALRTIRDEAAAKAAGSGAVEYFDRDGVRYERNLATGVEKPAAMPTGPNEGQGATRRTVDRLMNAEAILSGFDTFGLSGKGRFLENVPMAGNYMQSAEYQQYKQARDDFINARLRKESGAAISPSEYADADKQFFPQPGDSAQVVEQKRRARQVIIRSMADNEAGPGYRPRAVEPSPPPPGAPSPRGAPPPNHIEALRANPGLASDFDAKYGPGAADRVLRGGR